MLKKFLVTVQPTGCVRTRFIVKADSSFGAIDKAWAQAEKGCAPYDADTYIAVRPATPAEVNTNAHWMI